MGNLYIASHPLSVLLATVAVAQSCCAFLQVGEFYKTMGTDAVMLVQHAGLNPMGQGDPPRAGCPVVNLRRTISDLVEQAGLSVVSSTPANMHVLFYVHRSSQKCMLLAETAG